ncbi:MAG: RrF2 family transcriptional regulator [Brevinematia bacterium]
MIKVSTRVLYGLRAIIYLGLNKDRWPISLNEIANKQNIPLRYIEQIFMKFKKGNIVKSYRGVKGGYGLIDNYENLTLLEIVEVCDGRIFLAWCLNPNSKKECLILEDCILANIFRGIGESLRSYLAGVKLRDILNEAQKTDFLKLLELASFGNFRQT